MGCWTSSTPSSRIVRLPKPDIANGLRELNPARGDLHEVPSGPRLI